ncbi:MAG: phospho-N-acetylmuramoyl-pentapeptide-transferase [Verrucomicrobia bacterium]|nr:MAG: phospho-N-acetylmuramoyl-pentapeptide-transferase [Verrucomicrobiota bacterium]
MLSYLASLEHIWGPFRLFGYLTFRGVLAVCISLIIGFCLAPWICARLRKLKAAQSLRSAEEVGRLAQLHANKKDIPTMGGILIYLAIVPTVLLCAKLNVYVLVALIVYTGLTFIGFLDDYLKISKKNSKGLNSKWKLAGQAVLTFVAIGILLGNVDTHLIMSELWVPFYKYPLVKEMPIWFIFIFFFFVMAGSSNAINLTDGIDGLAIGCVIPTFLVYAIIAYFVGNTIIAHYLNLNYIHGSEELAIVCAATFGAALVFLWYNSHPAEVFMGDTGSLGLGGLIGAIAFMVHEPFTLVIIGGVFVMEAMSVILQIASFKLVGKRIFRMAPIHHHFELKGWHENKVVIRFWIIGLLFALAGLSTLKLR